MQRTLWEGMVLGADDVSVGQLLWATVSAVFFLLPLALTVWALLDVASRPSWAWALAGRNRVVWMTVIALGVLTLVGGIVVSTFYLVRVRPVVAAAERGDLPGP
jgi:hypothetical protein